jgi:hypothetical protein
MTASSHGLLPSRAVVGLPSPWAAGIVAAMAIGVVAAASPPWGGTSPSSSTAHLHHPHCNLWQTRCLMQYIIFPLYLCRYVLCWLRTCSSQWWYSSFWWLHICLLSSMTVLCTDVWLHTYVRGFRKVVNVGLTWWRASEWQKHVLEVDSISYKGFQYWGP